MHCGRKRIVRALVPGSAGVPAGLKPPGCRPKAGIRGSGEEPGLRFASSAPSGLRSYGPARKSSDLATLVACFPLPWSAYVRLLSIKNAAARSFFSVLDQLLLGTMMQSNVTDAIFEVTP